MKKVMLFITALLFTVGANAASIHLVNDITDLNAPLVGIVPNDSSTVVASFANLGGNFLIGTAATTDTTGDYKVEWTFNPSGSFNGGNITLGEDSTVYGFSQAITGAYSFVTMLTANVAKYFDISAASTGAMGFQLSVSAVPEVPVPAALFLFAPALLGFFGLRRKATSALAA